MKIFLKEKSTCIFKFNSKTSFKFHSSYLSEKSKINTLFKISNQSTPNYNLLNFSNKKINSKVNTIDHKFSDSDTNLNQILNLFIENSKTNIYKGVELDLNKLGDNIPFLLQSTNEQLDNIINHSLLEWQRQGVRSITIKIPKHFSNFIKKFLKFNFYFHHTTEDTLTVCKWLDESTPNKIPKFAHHHIGIGACIINKNMQLLMIREKYSTINKAKNQPLWKLVTGLVEEGESILEATFREIKEEVNMEVNYHGCVIITERFPAKFNLTDLCFFSLCSVEPKSDKENCEIKIDATELTEAKFFSINEVQDIMNEKMCTQATEITLRKVLTLVDFSKDLEENLKIFEDSPSLMSVKDFNDKNMKFLNMFL